MNLKSLFQKLIKKLIWIAHCYQIIALKFLLKNKRSGLFLDPGLGKTSISLAAISYLKPKGVLLVAPLSVVYSVWPEEIKKWDNFKDITCTILHAETKHTLHENHDIYLINPEGLPWLLGELLKLAEGKKPMPFDTLWIDESTKFKSPKVQTKNKTRTRFGTLIDMLPLFKRRHIMTGTPCPKTLMDLWAQIFILDEGEALGASFYQFRNRYYYLKNPKYDKYNWTLKDGAAEKIQKAISHLVLDMSAQDYLDLPEVVYNDIRVILSEKDMSTYKEMERELFIEIEGQEATAIQSAIATMKCHQIANGRVYEDIPDGEGKPPANNRKQIKIHTAKLDALADLVDELNGKPVLVAYHYQHDLEAIKARLGRNIPHIGSGVPAKDVKRLVKLWNAGKLPILLGHPCSMAHGLNMQKGGNDVCWFSLTWNLEDYLQFNARVNRQGVVGQVRIHHLVSKGTVDEAMLTRLDQRATQQRDLRKALRAHPTAGSKKSGLITAFH